MLEEFQEVNEDFCALCREVDPGSLVLVIKQGAKPSSIAGLTVEIEAHICNHRHKLEKALLARK
jgi:hypothetical protein